MSPLVRKEIRLLLPNSALIVCLLGLIMLVPRHFNQGVSFALVGFPLLIICPILVALTVIGAFGREVSPEMIGQFLSQPISRARLWCFKTSLLTLLIALLWWVWWQVYQYHFIVNHTPAEMAEMHIRTPLLAAALLSGGLWAILVTRSIVTAFWIAALAPAVPNMFGEGFLEGRVANPEAYVTALLAVYVAVGFVAAYRLFLRLQQCRPALELSGLTDFNQSMPRMPNWFHRFRSQHLWMTLLCKELRMHRGFLSFIGWNTLMHLGVVAFRSSVDLSHSPTVGMMCSYYWVSWLVPPVLVGCHAISEERRFGVWESQLTLPYPRFAQFAIKVLVVGVLAVISGSILPVVLERNQILVESRFDPMVLLQEQSQLEKEGGFSRVALLFAQVIQALPFHPEPLVELALVSLGLLTLSIFASSVAPSIMHALSITILGLLVGLATSLVLMQQSASLLQGVIRSPLTMLLITSTLVVTAWWRSVRNSYRVAVGPELWARNAITLVLALVGSIAISSLVYHRSWERLSPLDGMHGAARFKIEDNIHINAQWRALSFTTADGRSWSAGRELPIARLWDRHFGHNGMGSLSHPLFQVLGSNWTQVIHAAFDVVGIQKDGSLWVSAEPQLQHTSARSLQSHPDEPVRMVRFGKDRDWKQVVPYRSGVLLLASNGTLWVWQKLKVGAIREYQGLSQEVPSEISSSKDWTELRGTSEGWGSGFELHRQDGSAWIHPHENVPMSDRMRLDESTELGRARYLESVHGQRRADALHMSDRTEPFKVGINRDGRLEVIAVWRSAHDARRWSYQPTTIPVEREARIQWVDVASAGNRGILISLRADGTLWKWRFPNSPTEAPGTAKAEQLGMHSDWVALASVGNEIITLAADGSLWSWQFDSPFGTGNLQLLAPSSKPRLLGNILAGSR